ncbi:MAG: microviridin/marinostatin family tricyclic proteinase inhibitor [Planctomycetes bacterium]|nr:microviridin/marinostatin family tricyclic proteinase inhibitor [Planctomycetota bacterium]
MTSMKSPQQSEKRPFFARFLEGQEFPKVKTNVKGGVTTRISDTAHTLKYPSDDDEGGPTA